MQMREHRFASDDETLQIDRTVGMNVFFGDLHGLERLKSMFGEEVIGEFERGFEYPGGRITAFRDQDTGSWSVRFDRFHSGGEKTVSDATVIMGRRNGLPQFIFVEPPRKGILGFTGVAVSQDATGVEVNDFYRLPRAGSGGLSTVYEKAAAAAKNRREARLERRAAVVPPRAA
jgi:hypothetical protein